MQSRGALASTAVIVALLILGLYFAWPVSLGGSTAYIVTHGTSMEPRFHTGDLAIMRVSSQYHVGDIVAYHSDALHTVVMHRIVKIQNGLYTFKGDNNSWLDPDPVTKNELIGSLSRQIKGGGVWLHRARSVVPIAVGLILILAAIAITTGRKSPSERPRHGSRRENAPTSLTTTRTRTGTLVTALSAVLGLLLLTVAWLAWTGTTTKASTPGDKSTLTAAGSAATASLSAATVASPDQVVFSYSAKVKPSAAYDGTTVRSPDPIFRKVTESVDVHFDYTGAPGSVAVTGILSAPSGWHTSIKLAPTVTFAGDHYAGTVHLNIAVLAARAQAAAKVTAFPTSLLTMAVQPSFTAVGAKPWAAPLKLNITPLQLTVANGPASLTVTAPNAPAAVTPPTAASNANAHSVVLLGRRIPRSTAAVLAVVILLGSAASGTLLLLRKRRERNDSEADSIKKRHAALLVAVAPMPVASGRPVVDVADMATLVKLADRYGLLILHWARSGIETFMIQDQNTTYRYRAADAEPRNSGRHRPGGDRHADDLGAASLF
ncbi:MAG: hypothetical protein JWO63_2104 [Frankiales bacterium]|nr:hypothetical protein [Frankiales bacterium]